MAAAASATPPPLPPPRLYTLRGFSVRDAAFIAAVLNAPRGWRGGAFVQVPRATPASTLAFTMELVPPPLMAARFPHRHLAGLSVTQRFDDGTPPHISVHGGNWAAAPAASGFGAARQHLYRAYVVNHEVGHALGHEHDTRCAAPGAPAPVMMQQSLGTDRCAPNPWPCA